MMSFMPDFDWLDFPRMLNEICPNHCDELLVVDFHEIENGRPTLISRETRNVDRGHKTKRNRDEISISSEQSSSSREKKRVSFSTLEIREYCLTIGDNPTCIDGLPISLDWEHTEKSTIGIHTYESLKVPGYPRKLTFRQRLRRLQRVTGIRDKHLLLMQINATT
mmetsp:Transcript_29964/g.42507  ORF Transcript_29964/g.42507 Transcript_29964/m.42507 type:complete len:165 (+) Transcript_29964:135-629(+)